MTQITMAALAIITVTSIVLWLVGNRFTRRFVALNRAMPPLTWMFRRTEDEQLEQFRRTALAILPVYLVALLLYLFQP